MIAKAAGYVMKKVAFRTLDALIPGVGYMTEKVVQAANVANMLGSKATPERVGHVMELMDDAGDFAKETLGNILEWLLDS